MLCSHHSVILLIISSKHRFCASYCTLITVTTWFRRQPRSPLGPRLAARTGGNSHVGWWSSNCGRGHRDRMRRSQDQRGRRRSKDAATSADDGELFFRGVLPVFLKASFYLGFFFPAVSWCIGGKEERIWGKLHRITLFNQRSNAHENQSALRCVVFDVRLKTQIGRNR